MHMRQDVPTISLPVIEVGHGRCIRDGARKEAAGLDGAVLRELRESLDISQEELAEMAGVSQSFISRIELIKPGDPIPRRKDARRRLQRVALALGTTYQEVTGISLGVEEYSRLDPLVRQQIWDTVGMIPPELHAEAVRALQGVLHYQSLRDRDNGDGTD